MTKEPDLETVAEKENFWKGVLFGTGRQGPFTGHLNNVGKVQRPEHVGIAFLCYAVGVPYSQICGPSL